MRFYFFFLLCLACFSQAMEPLRLIGVHIAVCTAKKTVQAKSGDEFQAINDAVQKKDEYQAPRESLLKRDKSSCNLRYDSEKSSDDGERLLNNIFPDSSSKPVFSGCSYFELHYPFSARRMAIPIFEEDSESESLAEAAKKNRPYSR